MRIQHWLAPVLSVLVLISVSFPANAQAPMSSTDAFHGGYQPTSPGTARPSYMAGPSSMFGEGAAGYPPFSQAWPGAYGPYQNEFTQLANEDGLWSYDIRNGGKKWFFGAEALLGTLRRPGNTIVGNAGFASPLKAAQGGDDDDDEEPSFQGDGFLDFLFLGRDIRKNLGSTGLRLRGGFMRQDDTGMELEGWWLPQATFTRSRGNLVPVDRIVIEDNTDLRPHVTIPIDEDKEIFFDKFYSVEYASEAAGAALTFLKSPRFKKGPLSVRAEWGLRYMLVREKLAFRGAESTLAPLLFVFQNDPDDLLPDARLGEWAPDFEATDPAFAGAETLFTEIESAVQSHLAGPEFGIRYELGGDNDRFKLWGRSKIGALVDHDKVTLSTRNLGNIFDGDFIGVTNPAFSTSQSHTHISPVFEQGFFMEFPVFGYIPILRNAKSLQNAKARFGWTYIVVTELTRPADSYVLRSLPDTSAIKPRRSKWTTTNWSFAIDWTY